MLAGIADFFDGFAARMLKVQSDIGKDLDSLADLVSFGLVPSLVMFQLIKSSTANDVVPYFALIIAVLSGVRLARFNNDSRQTDHFHGLPVPANALFLCPLPILVEASILDQTLTNPYVLLSISVVMALLLVTDIEMLALKFKGFGWRGNELKYLIMLLSIVGFTTYQWVAFPFIILLYILTSIFTSLFSANN